MPTETTLHHAGAAPRGERRITEFRPDDAAAVAELFNGSTEGWPDGFGDGTPFTAAKVLQLQEDRQPLVTFISWEGDAAAGYCSFYEYPGAPGEAGYVGLLNAATRFHGRGHGRDLLKAALQRARDLGYRRLDLHTWQGNMRAVPLYKKSGYFWVPDTAVHMENYLPLLLGVPALADFWAAADWYRTQVRDLTVQEDRFTDGGMRVYPYEFRHGDRFVKATIDATARGLTALETERWRVVCRVDNHRLIVGRTRRVTWEVENRTRRPLTVTLLADGRAGLRLHREETTSVAERYAIEADVTAEAGYQPPAPGQRGPHVESLLLLDGMPLRLETGVEVKPAIEVRTLPRRMRLLEGQARDVTVQVQNHLAEAATVTMAAALSPGLSRADGNAHLTTTVGPDSYGGATLRVKATTTGAHMVELRPTVTTSADMIVLSPVAVQLPAVTPGGILAFEATSPTPFHAEREERRRELRVETATHRLVVELRGGGFHLEDATTGDYLVGGRVVAAPPVTWSTFSRLEHTATIEHQDGALRVRLRGPVPHQPALTVEHEFCLTAGGLLRLTTAGTNAGDDPVALRGGLETWGGNRKTLVAPTRYGLLASDLPEFPDWSDPELQRPELFLEQWVAREGDGKVAGVLWSDASRIEVGGWNLAELRQQAGDLAPGERRSLSPVYLYAGPGDRETIRTLWRTLVAPDAPEQPPEPRPALALTGAAAPDVLLSDAANLLTFSSLTNRPLVGELTWEAPPGWTVEPPSAAIVGARIGRDEQVAVAVRGPAARPGAASLRAAFRGDRFAQRVFDGAALDLGRGADVTVDPPADTAALWTVDNGYLRYGLAPGFVGSLVALETVADGVNHLLTAYPEAREFGWLRPWYGGLYAVVYSPGGGHFPDAGRLNEETLDVSPTEAAGRDGRIWRGLTVHSALATRGLSGLEMRASYLTLPGSNLLALRLAVGNVTDATLPVEAAIMTYVQPGGNCGGVELLTDPTGVRRLLRAQRTIGVRAGDWAAAINPQTRGALALVRGATDGETHVEGLDWGHLGAHLSLQAHFHLAPHSEQYAIAYLALAADEQEATVYGKLAGAGLL